ncbi:MAG: hypothetical protein AAGB22_00770 [Bacteroidota bacterium]
MSISDGDQRTRDPMVHPTREELQAYHADTLSNAERHELERHFLDCDLCQEASEGFGMVPVTAAAVSSVTEDLHRQFRTQPTSFLSGWGYKLLLAGLTGSLLIAAAWIYRQQQQIVRLQEEQPAAAVEEALPEERFLVPEAPEEVAQSMAEPVATPKPAEPASRPEAIATTESEAPEPELADAAQEQPMPEPLEPMSAAQPQPVPVSTAVQPTPKSPKLPVNYIGNYQVMDYSEVYDNDVEEEPPFPQLGRHTPASVEDPHATQEPLPIEEARVVKHRYEDVLELAMLKLQAGNYAAALEKFALIHGTFPEDQNAFFYGGLAEYHLGNHANALASFDQVMQSNATIFRQEARWYQALTLLDRQEGEDREAAKTILREIVKQGGFYQEQAQAKLDQMP